MIEPGKTVGILGGGQLGRMFAIAARRMGYRVHAFDPVRHGPTGQIADLEVNASYDDTAAAVDFARAVDVVTFEFENIPSQTLAAIEKVRPVFPSPSVLDTTRHRIKEKQFLSGNGFPVAPFRAVKNIADLTQAISELGTPCILKTAEFGYDGKGQSRIDSPDQAQAAWTKLNCPLGVLEGFVNFDCEISVIVARGQNGDLFSYPPLENQHRNHILDLTTWPANVSEDVNRQATDLAIRIAKAIDLTGVLCIEMFVAEGRVIVNELAPRPHNSGHLTIDAFAICQFEAQLRTVCGLPIGDARPLAPAAAMANLLGDLWQAGPPNFAAALADPAIKLHLYGKTDAKKGRKMGHLTAVASTPAEAAERVLTARERLSG
ncbi:MAG TPA: 5-(carboxyamino)imidazole ribonucleotide synthase [Tepidisphaeraceae bacterium]|jgi:5-(carboxyamino)imidazole ribonucleotide synthase